jgi:hypothetical protein
MAEKRDSRRIPFRTMLSYGIDEPPVLRSISTDLSGTGVCIKTNNVFKPGVELYMNFEVEGKVYNAYGIIMWAKTVPPGLARIVKNGMGVKFIYMDSDFLGAYNKKLEMFA